MNKEISIAKGFQTSINIEYDLDSDHKVSSFIPTQSSIEIIEDVLLSTSLTSTQRARMLIGAYGRGKSHLVLVLMSLLLKKNTTVFENLLNKIKENNPDLYYFACEYIDSKQKLLPIVVRGSSSSLTQSFLSALQYTLKEKDLDDLMPETNFEAVINTIEKWKSEYPKTYKKFVSEISEPLNEYIISLKRYDIEAYEKFKSIYPELTSGSEFYPFQGFDIVELYEEITLKLIERGYSGIYIIYDEFSKYLESSISSATLNDIKLLQDLAEKCSRSGKNQMHIMLISHKDISNYIDEELPKEKVDGWRGVSGRFKHINLKNEFSQIYEIMSVALKKDTKCWDEIFRKNKHRFENLLERFKGNEILDVNSPNDIYSIITGCYPLHPISTFILPRISERVAQNERTLFTFISSEDKYTLLDFWRNSKSEFPILTPDIIYDYFEPLLRKEPYNSNTHKIFKLTSSVLRKVDRKSLAAKIIKTISLIYLVEQFERLPPVYDVIFESFFDSVTDTNIIKTTIDELIDKECVIYLKRSNNYLKLKESSGIDISNEIINYLEKNKSSLNVKQILNQFSFDSYLYPARYNDEYEITRYFDFTFIYSSEFWDITDWDLWISDSSADGLVCAIIPSNQEEIEKINKVLLKKKYDHNQVVFVVPKKYTKIENVALEYETVNQLKALVDEDDILKDEYNIYIDDLSEVIIDFINTYLRPENEGSNYFYKSKRQKIYRKSQMSDLLSKICEKTFPYTPIINNESINKNDISTVAINSRSKIIAGLLENNLLPNLGLSGTGQDVSIMRSTLIQTGILVNEDTNPKLNLSPSDVNFKRMLSTIQEFFLRASSSNGSNFKDLYDRLILPRYGIGMKLGVIPIYISVILHMFKKYIVIKNKDCENKITPELLNEINYIPEKYSVIIENWSNEKASYLKGLESIYKDYVIEREKTYNSFTYILSAMNRWYMSLPKYTKEMDSIYLGDKEEIKFKALDNKKRRFINSLKQPSPNSREFLFEKILNIFGMEEVNLSVLDEIESIRNEFDNATSLLIETLIEDIKIIFGQKNDESSLNSVINDWYGTLSKSTTQFIFSNRENRILELMSSVTYNETDFIRKLAKAISGLHIEDWNKTIIEKFVKEIKIFKKTVEEHNNKNISQNASKRDMYVISFSDNEGEEVVKAFKRTEYSNRAKLLLNEISSSIEDMGESITEQEKRQVLMEMLEKLL